MTTQFTGLIPLTHKYMTAQFTGLIPLTHKYMTAQFTGLIPLTHKYMTAQFTGLIPLTQIHDRSIYWLDTPNTQIHDHSIYWLGTDTSIKRYGNKVVYGSKPPLSDLLYWTYNKLFADFDSINCTFYWSYFPLWWNENNICFFHNLLKRSIIFLECYQK
jgi:hypothetical protein